MSRAIVARSSLDESSVSVLAECDIVDSLLASPEWDRFLKAANRNAAVIAKSRQGAMSSWVARQHSAPWFARVRAAKVLPAKDKEKLLSVAHKKGGALVKCLLVLVWNLSGVRLELEKWANSYEDTVGITGSTVEKIQSRQDDASMNPTSRGIFSLGVASCIGHMFCLSTSTVLIMAVVLFFILTGSHQQRVAHCIAPVQFSSKASRALKLEEARGGVDRETRRELEKEENKQALRAMRQRDRRANAAALKNLREPLATQIGHANKTSIEGPCSESCDPSSSSAGNEVVEILEADDGLCVCCLSNEALFVVDHCGHCVFCRGCRRKMVYDTMRSSGRAPVDKHELRSRELTRTKVTCPLCRNEGLIVERGSYDGTVILT